MNDLIGYDIPDSIAIAGGSGSIRGHHSLAAIAPRERFVPPEFLEIVQEATRTVEDELAAEDRGWLRAGVATYQIITDIARIEAINFSRLYYVRDPLAKQAIRLWTDYTFGTGMTWSAEDKPTSKALDDYWNSRANQAVLSARGQRKSSDKLLVDGEVRAALLAEIGAFAVDEAALRAVHGWLLPPVGPRGRRPTHLHPRPRSRPRGPCRPGCRSTARHRPR
ncbi:hypothetical protein LCGC14_1849750 [marine sediment metagenome]|uniref:Uncharacterized protein n=1 Tax=marine sediment metagenome TaxID=412755 RepID=A0A0F9GAM5_9ZZZZ